MAPRRRLRAIARGLTVATPAVALADGPSITATAAAAAAAVGSAACVQGAREIEERALCVLPGFLSPTMVAALRREASQELIWRARLDDPADRMGAAYSQWVPDSPEFGTEHPRHLQHLTRTRFVGYSAFPASSLLRQVYESDEMRALISALLGERVYRCVDSERSLNLSVMQDAGDTHGWHYDSNAAVASIVIEAPESGGEFEWAPFSRDEGDENYDEMGERNAAASARPATLDFPGVSLRERLCFQRKSSMGARR